MFNFSVSTSPATWRQALFFFGIVIFMIGALMLIPAFAELVYGEPGQYSFAMSALMTMVIGLMVGIAMWNREFGAIRTRHAFLLIGGLWLVVPLFSAIPLLGYGLNMAEAYFEMASGFTTTGATVISGLDEAPRSLHLWRSMSQWIGGIGIIVMAIFILPFLRVGGMQLFRVESWEGTEKIFPHTTALIGWIFAVYVFFSIACFLLYVAGGMSEYDALNHMMTTVSTGGYSTHDASFGYFDSAFLEWVCIVFMTLGALPFLFFLKLVFVRGQTREGDSQVEFFLLMVGTISILTAFWLAITTETGLLDALRRVTFHVISIVTTTGYATEDYQLWGPGAVMLFFLLTFLGGCAGSTSGGIKAYRLVILLKLIRSRLLKLQTPNRIVPITFNGRDVTEDTIVSILTFLTLFTMSILIGALLLSFSGMDFITALTASATAICNVGPGLGEIIGPAGNFASMNAYDEIIVSFLMILGRLEIFAVLMLFDPEFWRY
ncbi:TrkH family potassium uptake protein [Parvularcula flava]|uniref:Trk system potassium uptake protein n=1 Tax=Aquisalinus luteolus TaxID=1566827 RepID=A0A8J3A1Z7_9PROT|nr:TrkH family potassium uptake protein [Aquisalinus luteolus]NHK26629.1 TrkH family potassium uptake protein [Aquisalinus luteolus]GGH92925.1 Trk system potassium uptake protein [Aquisalinus luteolus]